MTNNHINYQPGFRQRLHAERTMLMMPMNVVMAARISGDIDPGELSRAIAFLRKRHALLAVRVSFDEKNIAWFETDNVPEIPLRVENSASPDIWKQIVEDEWSTSFNLESEPLVRFVLIKTGDISEMIITAHHVVCDGTSLAYLIRDILTVLSHPESTPETLPPPPVIDSTTVPEPKKMNFLARLIMKLIHFKWEKQNISFSQKDKEEMLLNFWKKNSTPLVERWELTQEETEKLANKCKAEQVTVNSALWAAFLKAQYMIQGEKPDFRKMAGMAVSTRNRLKVPVGEAFGFYASSLSLPLTHIQDKSFWEAARKVHKKIHAELARTDIFRMLAAEHLPPSLLDSLYFSKYGSLKNKLALKMLQRMKWDNVSYGYSITNVGRINIPDKYGKYRLESVYGPFLYSDVNEKVVGVITVGRKLTFSFSTNGRIVDLQTVKNLRDETLKIIRNKI